MRRLPKGSVHYAYVLIVDGVIDHFSSAYDTLADCRRTVCDHIKSLRDPSLCNAEVWAQVALISQGAGFSETIETWERTGSKISCNNLAYL